MGNLPNQYKTNFWAVICKCPQVQPQMQDYIYATTSA